MKNLDDIVVILVIASLMIPAIMVTTFVLAVWL